MNSITQSCCAVKRAGARALPIPVFWRFVLIMLLMPAVLTGFSAAATIDVTAYGADGNDTLDDTAAITAAVATLTTGDTLLFPEAALYYKVATDANFSIDSKYRIRVVVCGRILAEGTPNTGDYVFNVTYSDDIEFLGRGSNAIIEGPGEYLFSEGIDGPCLIKLLQADRCTVRGLKLINGPAYSIVVRGGTNAKIVDCIFQGGPAAFQCCGVGAILFRGSHNLTIKSNRFIPGPNGEKGLSWIGSDGTSWTYHVSIIDNKFGSSFGHSIYCSGLHRSIIANNISAYAEHSGFKTIGTCNIIVNNSIYNAGLGGIQVRNGESCIVANNVIDQFEHVGIEVALYGGGYSRNYTDNIIEGNFIQGMNTGGAYDAIRIWGDTVSGNKIINNTILNADNPPNIGAVVVYSSAAPSYDVTISGNTIDQCGGDGLYLYNIHDSIISDNIIAVPAGRIHFNEQAGSSGNSFNDNILKTY